MSTPSLSEQQRKLLADKFFEAALSNAQKAAEPPDPTEQGEFVAAAAANYSKAMLQAAQAYMTVTNVGRR